jgi:hypothetical protein
MTANPFDGWCAHGSVDDNVSRHRHRTSPFQCLPLFLLRAAPPGTLCVRFRRQDPRLLRLSLKFLANPKNHILSLRSSSQAPLFSLHLCQLGRKEGSLRHHFTHLSPLPQLLPSPRPAHPVLSFRLRLRYRPSHPQAITHRDSGRSCPFLLPVPLFAPSAGVIWSVLTHWPASRDAPVLLVVFRGRYARETS